MRPTQWFVVSFYAVLIAMVWIGRGAGTGLLLLACVLVLLATLRFNEAGRAIAQFARRLSSGSGQPGGSGS
jgi:hypothetical protein